jgi:3-hydroxybutyryl-CoA dehydrogenase
MEIRTVGVLGCGLMGSGIIQVCAQAGYKVIAVDIDEEILSKSFRYIENRLSSRVEKGKLSSADKDGILANIKITTSINELRDCDLIEEAVPENMELKKDIFRKLDSLCDPKTILGTNTSCLSVTDIAVATKRQGKVMGIHFHNPAPIMQLLELVNTIMTNQDTVNSVKTWGETLGKKVVISNDVAGFIVTRLLTPFLVGAVKMLEEGIATRDEIDASCKLALNHPMGPLELIDFIGLDTELSIDEIMYDETKDTKYAPPNLLKKMVTAGRLGRKVGRGFYDYKQ